MIFKMRFHGVFILLWAMFCIGGTVALASEETERVHFVPNSQKFWDFSKHWTTNYGPAYRDVVETPKNFLPCTGQYALCFTSGPEPLPCRLDESGRFANCKCTIEKGLQFVTINSILNYKVYKETVEVCGSDGSKCLDEVDKAPVCRAIREGKLIPGADIISTFNPKAFNMQADAIRATATLPITRCPKGPYAGCMTAPCKIRGNYAECSCPVFYGPFQLTRINASCTLDDDLVYSASYSPALDSSSSE